MVNWLIGLGVLLVSVGGDAQTLGDDLYVVANSQFRSFTAQGEIFGANRLFETVILRVPLT